MVSVLLDATPLAGAAAYRGVGTYVRQLASALAREPDLRVLALDPGVELPAGVTSVPIRRRAPGRLQATEQELRLPIDLRRAARAEIDVFHSTGIDAPRRCPRPFVQTLYDVIPLVSDDPALAKVRRRWGRLAPRYRRADAVIAISRHAADDGIRTLGLDPGRVSVAPLGVGPDYTPEGPAASADEPYLLSVGEHSRRKGLAEAFAVIGELADAGYPHHLRVAGRIAPWVRPELEALRRRAAHPERIELLGWVPDLAALYRGATALVVASRYEGFGLPAVEAMACGTPVVAFDNSATSEVVGGGGLLVTDGDVPALTAALRALIDDDSGRRELGRRGLARARHFDWDACARTHAEVYRSVVRH